MLAVESDAEREVAVHLVGAGAKRAFNYEVVRDLNAAPLRVVRRRRAPLLAATLRRARRRSRSWHDGARAAHPTFPCPRFRAGVFTNPAARLLRRTAAARRGVAKLIGFTRRLATASIRAGRLGDCRRLLEAGGLVRAEVLREGIRAGAMRRGTAALQLELPVVVQVVDDTRAGGDLRVQQKHHPK